MSRFVYKLGQRVRSKIGNIEGLVTGVSLRNNIQYEMSYFVNAEYRQAWLYDFEIEAVTEKRQAGFNRHKEDEPLLLDEFK